MKRDKQELARDFICPKCRARGAFVQEVQLGRAMARIVPLPSTCYLAASCTLCGYTELYNLAAIVRVEDEMPATAHPASE